MEHFASSCSSSTYGSIAVGEVQGVGAREAQQDSCGVSGSKSGGVLAVVADGMGGLVNSDQVSNCIVNTMTNAYSDDFDKPARYQLLSLLRVALDEVAKLTADSNYDSGSTLVCCKVGESGLSWLSVGDSRIYLWRSGGLIQLSSDHDFAHDLDVMTVMGQLSAEEASQNPRRGSITSFIGSDFPRHISFNSEPVELLRGDKVILMSDGVYRSLNQSELNKCLKSNAKKSALLIDKMIQAKNLKLQDNYTAVVIEIK